MPINPYREIPSVAELVSELSITGSGYSQDSLTAFTQQFLNRVRREIQAGIGRTRFEIFDEAARLLVESTRSRLEPVINATGVIIHTNLGRSPVSQNAAIAMRDAASGYVSLELEPFSNERGGRMGEFTMLMRLLTGAEATLVVNNNAAAILLVLSSLGRDKEVIVSRGEAVEIGGGFRIPDVMSQSGAHLVEVGTTNRTYARDYERAVTSNTAGFLKVHASNFTMGGFTATTSIEELADLSKLTGVPVIEDLGSGALVDTSRFGITKEPTIGERIAAGADLITASGDKLLGGPQAGIIAGRSDLVDRVSRHPLARAVRADKVTLAGMAATLRHYVAGDEIETIPVWRMISTSTEHLWQRANSICDERKLSGSFEIVDSVATIGGGSLPGQTLPSVALSIASAGESVDDLARRLRMGTPRIFGRIERGQFLIDLRSVLPEHDVLLGSALSRSLNA